MCTVMRLGENKEILIEELERNWGDEVKEASPLSKDERNRYRYRNQNRNRNQHVGRILWAILETRSFDGTGANGPNVNRMIGLTK